MRDLVGLLWCTLRLLDSQKSQKYRSPKHLSDRFARKNVLEMQEILLWLCRRAFGASCINKVHLGCILRLQWRSQLPAVENMQTWFTSFGHHMVPWVTLH